ncbi:MAG: hypothetical protein HYZ36_08645, partial [Pedosphaera parvula]|nr:hypothetical protein [Pedosphaera parvula]
FYCLAAARSGQSAAKWTVIFLTAFPGALHFQFNYTESLFLLLVLLLWWGMEEQRLGWAWLAAVLLPLTRGVGVFAVLPIGWYLVTRKPPPWLVRVASGSLWRRKTQCVSDHEIHEKEASTGEPPVPSGGARDGSVNVPTGNPAAAGSSGSPPVPVGGSPALPPLHRGRLEARSTLARWCWRDFVLLLAPLVGWAGYLGLMWQWTGNPFEGFEAQKHWGVHSVSNLIDVPKFLLGFFEPTEWHAFTGSLLDRCVFILLLYTLPVQWRLDKGLLVWTYMLGVLPAMSGTFTSLTRFASCAFPMFIALGAFLSPECAARSAEGAPATRPSALVAPLPCLRAAVRWGLLAVFVTLHIVLVWRFVNFRWAG